MRVGSIMIAMSMQRSTLKNYPRAWGKLRPQRLEVHRPARDEVPVEESGMGPEIDF